MANPAPLDIVFFDVGGTLGEVETAAGRRRLRVFASTAGLLTAMRQTLGLRIGVISNILDDMTTDYLRAMLAEAGLTAMLDDSCIVTNKDAHVRKPCRKIYEFAARRAGVAIERCLYVGDEADQVEGAQKAGMAGLLNPPNR